MFENDLGILDIGFKYKLGGAPFPMQRYLWKLEAHKFLKLPFEEVTDKSLELNETKNLIKEVTIKRVKENRLISSKIKESAEMIGEISATENFTDAFFMGRWAKYKQVYKFDNDCMDMLCKTELKKVYTAVFNNLPFISFYIEADFPYNCVGCFVSIVVDSNDNKRYLGIEFVRNDNVASFFTAFLSLEEGEIDIKDMFEENKEQQYELCKKQYL